MSVIAFCFSGVLAFGPPLAWTGSILGRCLAMEPDIFQTAGFFRPAEESPSRQGYHWNGNAETYYLIGEAMGEAMKKLYAK